MGLVPFTYTVKLWKICGYWQTNLAQNLVTHRHWYHIHGWYPFPDKTRPDQELGMIGQACIVDTGSCLIHVSRFHLCFKCGSCSQSPPHQSDLPLQRLRGSSKHVDNAAWQFSGSAQFWPSWLALVCRVQLSQPPLSQPPSQRSCQHCSTPRVLPSPSRGSRRFLSLKMEGPCHRGEWLHLPFSPEVTSSTRPHLLQSQKRLASFPQHHFQTLLQRHLGCSALQGSVPGRWWRWLNDTEWWGWSEGQTLDRVGRREELRGLTTAIIVTPAGKEVEERILSKL